MAKLKIDTNIPALDGEFELDTSYFTNRELHMIKKLSGLRAGEFEEAVECVAVVMDRLHLCPSGGFQTE